MSQQAYKSAYPKTTGKREQYFNGKEEKELKQAKQAGLHCSLPAPPSARIYCQPSPFETDGSSPYQRLSTAYGMSISK